MPNFLRVFLERLRRSWKGQPRLFKLEQDIADTLDERSYREQRQQPDLAEDLLAFAMAQNDQSSGLLELWLSLTAREQEVTALICLNYTNSQIAARLRVSPATVKSHIQHTLTKLNVHSKADLRLLWREWDFHEWEARYRRRWLR